MATPNGNGKTRSATNGDSRVTDIDGTTGAATGPVNDIPVDDGPDDNRLQLSKLSLSLMGCQGELSIAKEQTVIINGQQQKTKVGETIHQATVFGYITGLTGPKELPNAKPGEDNITHGLMGNIEGVNILTGEMFKAAILYLPAGFHDMFLTEMESSLRNGGQSTIAFALDFYSTPASNPRGYTWQAKDKMPMTKADPLARIRQRAMTGVVIKALQAPEKTKAIA